MTRFVRLDRHLLARLVEEERDPMQSEMARMDVTIAGMMVASSHGLAYAMIDGGEVPIGAALLPHFWGHAEVCCFVSRFARPRHLVLAARWARAFLDVRQRSPQFRRVQMFVRTNEPWSQSFPRALGFECEGLHGAWDAAGRDYWCYARVKR
jgi:hypothetical protein